MAPKRKQTETKETKESEGPTKKRKRIPKPPKPELTQEQKDAQQRERNQKAKKRRHEKQKENKHIADTHVMHLMQHLSTLPPLHFTAETSQKYFSSTMNALRDMVLGVYRPPMIWFQNKRHFELAKQSICYRNSSLLGEMQDRSRLLPFLDSLRSQGDSIFMNKFYSRDNMRLLPRFQQQFHMTSFPKEIVRLVGDCICEWVQVPQEQNTWIRYDTYFAQFLQHTHERLYTLYTMMI